MPQRVSEVAPEVFVARGTDVNWVLLRDGADVTLIDTGYPGDLAKVEESLHAIGRRPSEVRAVLITHAHVDHIGGVNHFADRYGAAVYTDPIEVVHAHRDYLEQAMLSSRHMPCCAGPDLRCCRRSSATAIRCARSLRWRRWMPTSCCPAMASRCAARLRRR